MIMNMNIGKSKLVDIKTSYDYPPIPIRNMDWSAWVDGNEEGPIGRGTTEQDAMQDLIEVLESVS